MPGTRSQNVNETNENTPAKLNRKPSLLTSLFLVVVVALAGANLYSYLRMNKMQDQISDLQSSSSAQFSTLQAASTEARAAAQQRIEVLQLELEGARKQAALAVGQAKADAQKHATELASRLEAEQHRQQEVFNTQLTAVQTGAEAKFQSVDKDVDAVRSEVASARTEIQNTIADLQRARGDMGVMSGLIATNGKELDALKALGERHYFEFNLAKTKEHQKIGNVAVKLKKADVGRNKFTLELIADDKRVEKKDKTINEPVQFYAFGYQQPLEMVVNEVQKDRIKGYLAVPKIQTARN
jgi:flagellar basal body-associated protein FliL